MIFNARNESPSNRNNSEDSIDVAANLGVPKVPQIETFVASDSTQLFSRFLEPIRTWNGRDRISFRGNEVYGSDRTFSYEDGKKEYNFEDLFSAFSPQENGFPFKQVRNPELAQAFKKELQARRELALLKSKKDQPLASVASFDAFVGRVRDWNSANSVLSVNFAEGYGGSGNFNYNSDANIDRLRAALVGGSNQNPKTQEFQIIVDSYFAKRALAFFEEKREVNVSIEKLRIKGRNRLRNSDIFNELQDLVQFPRADFSFDLSDYLTVQTADDLELQTELLNLIETVRKVALKSYVYQVLANSNGISVVGVLDAKTALSNELLAVADSNEQITDSTFISDILEDIRYKAELVFVDQVERIITDKATYFTNSIEDVPRIAYTMLVKGFEDAGLISPRFRETIARYTEQINALFYAYFTNEYLLFVSENDDQLTEGDIAFFIGTIPQESAEEIAFVEQIKAELYVQYIRVQAVNIRTDFSYFSAQTLVEVISELPEVSPRNKKQKTDLLEEYKSFLKERIETPSDNAESYRADYEYVFASEISVIRSNGNESYENPNLGQNVRAAKYSRDRYKQILAPALGVMRNDANSILSSKVESLLSKENRDRTIMDPELLRKRRAEDGVQTELTATEDQFLSSVRLLSKTNPYLVAMIRADRAFASVYIRRSLEKIAKKTKEILTDGSYTPLLIIGTGPAALSSIGEITRQNPALMAQALVVDKAKRAGGPFSVDGKAWSLNSANQAMKSRFLGDAPLYPEDDVTSITYYGDPTRWLPGQRSKQSPQKRRGDINKTASFSVNPDDISDDFYPNNEDLTLVLQAQMCVSVANYSAETEVLRVRPADEDSFGGKGNKIVTLRITEADGSQRVIDIRTDAIISASGGGEANYGFPLEGRRAEQIVADSKKQKEAVPNICTSLEAFKAFVSRYETDHLSGLGKQLVIVGKGNSLDTLLEYIIASFSGENSRSIKEIVEKIVVIAPNAPKDAREYLLTNRTRYARVAEEIDRAGIPKLITFIDSRVSDYGYVDDSLPVADRKMAIFDDRGRRITLPNGELLEADNIITAAGFKKDGDAIFEKDYQSGPDGLFKPLVLPTNKDIPVAEVLADDPTIMRVGVGGKTSLSREELLEIAKRSPEAARALTRVGAVNFVAIGVQARRAEAATNIFLQRNLSEIEQIPEQQARFFLRGGRLSLSDSGFVRKIGVVKNGAQISFNPGPVRCEPVDGVLPNNLTAEESLRVAATSFIAESMNDMEYYFVDTEQDEILDSLSPKGKKMNGQLTFRVTLDSVAEERVVSDDPKDVRNLQFRFSKGQYRQRRFGSQQKQAEYEEEVPITLRGAIGGQIANTLEDRYVQATLVKLLKNAKRRPPAIDITLGLRGGKISYPHTFIEMVSSRG